MDESVALGVRVALVGDGQDDGSAEGFERSVTKKTCTFAGGANFARPVRRTSLFCSHVAAADCSHRPSFHPRP